MKMDLKLTALAAALLLAGCASDSNNTAATATPATNHAEAASEVSTLKQQITLAEQRLALAKTQELDWLATDLMQEATQALQDAKEYYAVIEKDPTQAHSSSGFFSSTTNWQAAEENLKAFNDAVNQAEALQRQAHTLLAEAFSYRTQLHQLKANDIYPSTYQRLDGEFKTLIEWIADNDAERATQAQPALVTKLRALEVKTVVHLYLDDAKKTLASLKKANISQHAPDTLAAAAAAVVAAEAFITADPRDMDTIKQKADDAVFTLKHTRHIADAVQQLKLLPAKDYERYVVSQETILLNISQALGADDSRDRALPEQGQAIVAYIQQYQRDLADIKQLQTQLTTANEKVTKLENDLSQLNEQNKKVAMLEAQLATLHSTAPVITAAPVKAQAPVATETAVAEEASAVTETTTEAATDSIEAEAVAETKNAAETDTVETTDAVITESDTAAAVETAESAEKTVTAETVTTEAATTTEATTTEVTADAVTDVDPEADKMADVKNSVETTPTKRAATDNTTENAAQ
ncbi:hypothetical protein ACFFLZ_16005 [Photobacterium aphoticum]|nr:hypothetical protein [Photobacterium aphoticum]GHA48227.1 hypothetical protein GCM10007086_22370 [Photobacterium aphoticum]